MSLCIECKKSRGRYAKKYCSNLCQSNYQYKKYIKEWKKGNKSGNRGVRTKNLSKHLIRYLLEKYDRKCLECGWNKKHPNTKEPPLEVDHIDGDANNNSENNLRLLCPNCHSLTSNFRNFNKGKGRKWRRGKGK